MVPVPPVILACSTILGSFCTKVRGSVLVKLLSSSLRCVFFSFATEGEYEAAEAHLLAAGKRDSARVLADMFVQWSSTGGAPGVFALRGTIP